MEIISPLYDMPRNSQKINLLLADDDETVRNLLDYHSQKRGFEPTLAVDGQDFMDRMNDDVEVALLDIHMPRADGMECLQFLKERHPDTPAVVLSSADELDDAVQAMKYGAADYLTKPFDLDEVFHVLRQAIRFAKLKKENKELKSSLSLPSFSSDHIVGESDSTKDLIENVEKVAALDSTVLIRGESGVGKGLIARSIHQASSRADGPFITVSCPALPRELLESELFGHEKGAFTGAHQTRMGKIEMARNGTLFLDEIGDLPLDLQPKLLNVLQDREFHRVGGSKPIAADIRVIAATNLDLESQVQEQKFREDLYYRINVIPLEIPSLKERVEDVAPLSRFFLEKISTSRGLSQPVQLADEPLKILQRYDWPGNVRQLANVLERASAFCDDGIVAEKDLPAEVAEEFSLENDQNQKINLANMPLKSLEQLALSQTLRACGGNKAETARRLGITEKSVYNKLKRFGMS